MSKPKLDSRSFVPELTATASQKGEEVWLRSPGVGQMRLLVFPGAVVLPGSIVGELFVLGRAHHVRAPEAARGVVLGEAKVMRPAEIPVEFAQVFLRLDPNTLGQQQVEEAPSASTSDSGKLVLRAPSSGRLYARPGPDKPDFVAPGDVLKPGQTIALLEIMKTFHRITYGGEGLPERARVVAVLRRNEDDVAADDPILELEPLG